MASNLIAMASNLVAFCVHQRGFPAGDEDEAEEFGLMCHSI